MTTTVRAEVAEYLRRFDAVSAAIPEPRRSELRAEIQEHLTDSIGDSAGTEEASLVILEFGSPDEIVETELDGASTKRGTPRWVLRAGAIAIVAALVIFGITQLPRLFESAALAGGAVVTAHPVGVERVTTGRAYAEYQQEITKLSALPEGSAWPEGVPAGLDAGATVDSTTGEVGVLEAGAGQVAARFTWLCAWENEAVIAHDHSADDRLVAAIAELKAFVAAATTESWGPGGSWTSAVLTPTDYDNFGPIRSDVAESCMQAGITIH